MRLYEVSAGAIVIDGIDIRDCSQHDLRNIIAYVPQESVLFSGTVLDNIGSVRNRLLRQRLLKLSIARLWTLSMNGKDNLTALFLKVVRIFPAASDSA